MNKSQKKQLETALQMLSEASEIIAQVRAEEQNKFDNMTERGQALNAKLEDNAYALEEIESNVSDAYTELQSFIE